MNESAAPPGGNASAWAQAVEKVHRLAVDLIASLPSLAIALAVFAAFYAAGKLLRTTIRRVTMQQRRSRNLGLVLGRLSQGAMFILGVLVGCVIVFPNFTPAALLQFLGIGSVAIGFAFRDVLQNYLAGILLLLTEPFRIGDQVRFGGYEGTVEEIQTRATFLKTYDGRRVVIPNSELFTRSVVVNTAFEVRRIEVDVGVGYGDDIERAKALVLEALRGVGGVLPEPAPDVLVVDLAASAVTLRVRWWIRPPRQHDALDARDQVLVAIRRTLGEHGVDLPFPTTQVLFHDQTEETDGDRARQREGWPAGRGPVPRPRGAARADGARDAPPPAPRARRDTGGA
ncbi:mechanosensitive ion channel protein MscS [Sorangium cellulosum]|uniref:Mechanosensitive ion channel protein MscS n=1 Tax=Sorangium cellulosum TaxID=56 RepID=A0A4P2Q045_SORCE|nr:mechanosensitive ion channel family protein [Sorangium cellulosum]AUX22539.1 mechanosensitive ion channel protein MscS [Sorangium cellulosum]